MLLQLRLRNFLSGALRCFSCAGRSGIVRLGAALLLFSTSGLAQPLSPSLPRDRREPSRVRRNRELIPRDIVPQPVSQPPKGRNVVVLMAGIGWPDWARLAAQASPSAEPMPGLQSLLYGADLGALRLPGAPRGENFRRTQKELSLEEALRERGRISPAILRAAATISTGQPIGWPSSDAPQIPLAATATLGAGEVWSSSTPGFEDAPPELAYARRMGAEVSNSNSLANLAGSLWRIAPPGTTREDRNAPHFGALGDAMRRSGARVAAFGSADTNFNPSRTLPLREWALLACDGKGIIPQGDLSSALMTRDGEAPFGVRQDGTALLARVQGALDDQVSLIVVEWGDTRRAALYAPLCEPSRAARHKTLALQRADTFLRGIITRLAPEDRLFLISIPDLDTSEAQWIPCAYWMKASDKRAQQGSLISGGGEHHGVAPLESVFSTLLTRLANPNDMAPPNPALPLGSQGVSSEPLDRINRLASLQAGWSWLDAARPVAHGIWAIFFLVSIIILVALLTQSTPGARFGQVTETPTGLLSSSQNWARAWWSTTMLLPLLMWLGGLCIEAMWRAGALAGATQSTPTGWRLPVALVLIAIFIVGVAGLARTWFSRARLRGVRVGLIYLLLTIIGLLVGGFALPWNSLLGAPVLEGSTARAGDIWALLLISATLLGVGGMAQPSQRTLAQLAAEPWPRRTRNNGYRDAYDEEDNEDRPSRRIINLRPAVIWMGGVLLLLWLPPFGFNAPASVVAFLGFGTLWLRLWLERAERPQRLRKRRWIIAAALALGLLLLLPKGAPGVESALAQWWPRWLNTWTDWWWNLALLATALGVGAFLTSARFALRNYLRVRYAMRAMLAGAVVAAAAALIIFGSYGPPLIALYTLGAVIFQVLGAPSVEGQPRRD
jgi:hypothetical protein